MTFTLHPQFSEDGHLVANFKLSTLLMIKDAVYPWFVLVPRRDNISDKYQLSKIDDHQLTNESRSLSRVMMRCYTDHLPPAIRKTAKMNVAALGNQVAQLHIHHIVRHGGDPAWPAPIWGHAPLSPMDDDAIKTRLDFLKTGFAGEATQPHWLF